MNKTTPSPDLLTFDHGQPVRNAQDWSARREETLAPLLDVEYGGMPPAVQATGRLLYYGKPRMPFPARTFQYHVAVEGEKPYHFRMDLLLPAESDGPCPTLICGDGCWRYLNDVTEKQIIDRGYALAAFNRTEIIPDAYQGDAPRKGWLYDVFPQGQFGALAAWAWGVHRCVDVLATLPEIDASRLAVVGHSRGGKTALLAGATDDRLSITCVNNSGCGGAGSHHIHGPECEKIADILKAVPYWFGAKFKAYIGRDGELPFDQHVLKAAVAPRALLTTEALGDLWANPIGTWHTHQEAAKVYDLLGATDKLAIHYRPGPHAHGPEDFRVQLDFMDQQWKGLPSPTTFNINPFEG